MPNEAKKLIEVALPVKEISAESVRDKSIRHGHISTLHLWWARRPLPVSRAVVLASLVPDPDDPDCPRPFKAAVETLLKKRYGGMDVYKPYADIPWTAAIDPMPDTLRNRLLMFIGKFSDRFIDNEKKGKNTPAKEQLSNYSLIKWENKNNDAILNLARMLIWVAHDPVNNTPDNFDAHFSAIKTAENSLYTIPDRHLETPEVVEKQAVLDHAIEAFLNRMPKVFDPFAGGGAIPLEAARLGCRTYANDLNPVAHIIEKGSLEFPQKYGKPIRFTKAAFVDQYGKEAFDNLPEAAYERNRGEITGVQLENRLAWDVEYYSKKLLSLAEAEIGHFYPADEMGNRPVAYYWARVGKCANPSCGSEIPLLKQFYLANKPNKKVHLFPQIKGTSITFEIKNGKIDQNGWLQKGANLICPVCNNTTELKILKRQFVDKNTSERLLAVIVEGENGKEYRLPTSNEKTIFDSISEMDLDRPIESMDNGNYRDLKLPKWGLTKWHEMFSDRQLLAMQTFVEKLQEIKAELKPDENKYAKAVLTYLAILIDRIAIINTTFGRWNVVGEKIEHPFARQAIPFIFDYPESNPFSNKTGSAFNQLNWLIRYIDSENSYPLFTICNNAASGDKSQFDQKSLDSVVTDPPYFDAIAYADLSDFFYIWLKKTIPDLYPLNLAFPQTPKSEECTALKHHHDGSAEKAAVHFENKLLSIFNAIEYQTKGLISVMFAHQSTHAWTTLCNSILSARLNISGSWAIDSEMGARMIALGNAALESSITVSCKPIEKRRFGDFSQIRLNIENKVKEEVKYLYRMGYRGADLLTACFGQAVSVFGQYERVEKADGSEVSVAELLELAREAAFNAIVSDIHTDDYTRFYIGWLNLFGFTNADHDDVRRITQIGLNVDTQELLHSHILTREGNKESLAGYTYRLGKSRNLGQDTGAITLDKLHRAMYLYDKESRQELVKYLRFINAHNLEDNFWKVGNALFEVLPAGTDDHKQAAGLHANRESLVREARSLAQPGEQTDVFTE